MKAGNRYLAPVQEAEIRAHRGEGHQSPGDEVMKVFRV
jgi:hypothetical protein